MTIQIHLHGQCHLLLDYVNKSFRTKGVVSQRQPLSIFPTRAYGHHRIDPPLRTETESRSGDYILKRVILNVTIPLNHSSSWRPHMAAALHLKTTTACRFSASWHNFQCSFLPAWFFGGIAQAHAQHLQKLYCKR